MSEVLIEEFRDEDYGGSRRSASAHRYGRRTSYEAAGYKTFYVGADRGPATSGAVYLIAYHEEDVTRVTPSHMVYPGMETKAKRRENPL